VRESKIKVGCRKKKKRTQTCWSNKISPTFISFYSK